MKFAIPIDRLALVFASQDRIAGYRVSHGPSVERLTFCNPSAGPRGPLWVNRDLGGQTPPALALPRKRKQNQSIGIYRDGPFAG
jgi:hypothetical protein